MNKCQFCSKETDMSWSYYGMTPIQENLEKKIDKLGRNDWWKKLEDPTTSKADLKKLDELAFYDQLLNTVGRGIVCEECIIKDDELYEKYYGRNTK